MWVVYAFVLFVARLSSRWCGGPDEPSTDTATASMTMTFVVMGLGTAFNALVNRRDPTSGLTAPIAKALAIGLVPVGMVFLATQLPVAAGAACAPSRSPADQWLVCAGLAALLPIVVEVGKVVRRRRTVMPSAVAPDAAVAPERARTAPGA